MAFRFNKRIKLSKGLGINLSKSGISTSYRTKSGSVNSKGFSIRTGIPGLTYRKRFKNSGCALSVLLICMSIMLCVSCSIDSNCKCSDFSSQSEAQSAFNNGCDELDRDNDGIACENLPN
ncbi:DUF4236 domain-containing protein [Dokdonia ponticola]|uniref:DUF4236 domain-containing protein n=1 Tax=Dokdonia ponticola TaxID=2041041 RepID=A0ABV9I157_9FLAO